MTISSSASLHNALDFVRHRDHATAGFTIALTGAMAAALGQACVRISKPAGAGIATHQRLGEVVTGLRDSGDADATALENALALRAEGKEEEGWDSLLAIPVRMADLACDGAEALQSFRPHVVDQVHDDMEFALHLLAATARAALLLVESNLRQWRMPALHAKYGPETERLAARIDALMPLKRIEWT
ncbi:MAG: cyclodeaminase/cyclohydrolase family protein [Chloroflexi bacterium]|nr:cyclodeaminase/cyclohydrolase family protein [Chloroflexota bacterium]